MGKVINFKKARSKKYNDDGERLCVIISGIRPIYLDEYDEQRNRAHTLGNSVFVNHVKKTLTGTCITIGEHDVTALEATYTGPNGRECVVSPIPNVPELRSVAARISKKNGGLPIRDYCWSGLTERHWDWLRENGWWYEGYGKYEDNE